MDSELLNHDCLSVGIEKLPASGLLLKLQPDSRLLSIYVIFFILLIISLFLLPIANWLIIVLMVVISAYFQWIFRQFLLLNHPKSVNQLVFTEKGWCLLQLNNDQILKMTILADTILTEHLVILNLKKMNDNSFIFSQYHVLISANSVGKDKFWALKRYLRFKMEQTATKQSC